MTCLTNYLNRFFLTLVTTALLMGGCAGLDQEKELWSLQLRSSRPSPQPALRGTVVWTATTATSAAGLSYEFHLYRDAIGSIVQKGSSPQWNWQPNKPGNYRVEVLLQDAAGNLLDSQSSEDFIIEPALNEQTRIAFLPAENLSDSKAPLKEIGNLFSSKLQNHLPLLGVEELEQFMRRHRLRDTGGISQSQANALLTETGSEAVFITSLETWKETNPPRVSLISRVVTTGPNPQIAWMDSVGLVGDEYPGVLGLGRIVNPSVLLEQAVDRLVASFAAYLDGKDPSYRHRQDQKLQTINARTGTADESLGESEERYAPQFSYRASTFDPTQDYSVAVIPFLNINAKKHAGKIVTLHIVKQLQRYENLKVFEPGLVRDTLLKYRMIMQAGPSLAASDILSDKNVLDADLIVSGKVFDYQGEVGESKVDFSLQAFDGRKREVIWTSRSYAAGNDGVYFYNWGKIPSVHGLTSRMTATIIKQLEE